MKKESAKEKVKDIRGLRFGKLTVIEPTDKRADGGSVVWKCHCDCGNDTEVSWNRLRKGKARSCGCLSNPPHKDYIGKRFGRLNVIKYAGKLNPNSTEQYWNCLCECGNEIIVGQKELQSGDTVSCGCYQKEKLLESMKLIDHTSVTILEHCKKPRVNNKSGYTGVFREKSAIGSEDMMILKRPFKPESAEKKCTIIFSNGITRNTRGKRTENRHNRSEKTKRGMCRGLYKKLKI